MEYITFKSFTKREEYIKLGFRILIRRKRTRILFFLIVYVILVGVFEFIKQNKSDALTGIVVSLLLLILAFLMSYYGFRRNYSYGPLDYKCLKFTIDNKKIQRTSQSNTLTTYWNSVKKVFIVDNAYFVNTKKGETFFLKLHDMNTSDQRVFLNILESKGLRK